MWGSGHCNASICTVMFVVDAPVEVVEGDVSVSVDVYETVTLRFVVAVFDNNHIGTHGELSLPWRWRC
jgi:hypothetical protein